MSTAVAITLFVVGLVVAIMIHEWGHFVTARRFGMRADRFFLGFGPTVWSTQRGETEYGVKALPLGGFVRILGMSEGDRRLQSVAADILDVEAVQRTREAVAEARLVDVDEIPAMPEPTWHRLEQELVARGTPPPRATSLVADVRARVPADATPSEVARELESSIDTSIADSGRLGDLRHRLLRGDDGRFFHDRPAWQRFIVLVAGAGSHFVVAAALLFAGFAFLDQPFVVPSIDAFADDGPAVAAGFDEGDEFVTVGGATVTSFEQLRDRIRGLAGETVTFEVLRDGKPVTITATVGSRTLEETGQEVGYLGFVPAVEARSLGVGEAARESIVGEQGIFALTGDTITSLGRVFGPDGLGRLVSDVSGDTDRNTQGAVSIVGAASLAGEGTEVGGVFVLVLLLAMVNVFVGVFNLLPLPPLDGGHVAVLAVERAVNLVRSQRGLSTDWTVDPRTIAAIAVPVIAFVGTVSVALLWLDITNPISIQ